MGTHKKGSFLVVSNIQLNLIRCKDKVVISSILQSCVFYWYHMYLFHPVMIRAEEKINQHVYWTGIRNAVRKEATNRGTYQCTKRSNIKYGKLPAKNLSRYHGTNSVCI